MQRSGRPAGRIEPATFARGLTSIVLLLATYGARAEEAALCGSGNRPWVSVEFSGQPWEKRSQAEVLADLRARFRPEQIDVCWSTNRAQASPLAAITLRMWGSADLLVTIELQDRVTKKRVGRSVSLAGIPEDGRPLATAIAADELLRASWAEVALEKRNRPRQSPPPQVDAAVRRVLPRKSSTPTEAAGQFSIGSRVAIERYDQHTQLGLDFFLRPRLAPSFGIELALGLRDGLDETSENGRIDATAGAVGAGAWLSIARFPAFELSLDLGVRATRVVFSGEPAASASGREASGWAVYGRGGLFPSLRIVEPLWLGATLGVGAPIQTFAASDDSQVVTGMRGLERFMTLGLLAEL